MQNTDLLFHFTKNSDVLKSIMLNGFYPYYNYKYTVLKNNKYSEDETNFIEDYYPIVGFCNISLSDIDICTTNYGDYAIAISKKWAVKHGVNPVIYAEPKSPMANFIKKIIEEGYTIFDDSYETINRSAFIEPFIKNNHCLENTDIKKKGYNNSAEREYVYCPTFIINESKNDYEKYYPKKFTKKSFEKANRKIRKFKLKIKPKHIKYILLKNSEDVGGFIEFLKENFSEKQVYRLLPKIITKEQLNEDF